MAAGIGGQTVHSFGNVAYKDKRGKVIRPHDSSDVRDVPAMSIKCGALRWLFGDEVEATGAETIGHMEQIVRLDISSKSKYKRIHRTSTVLWRCEYYIFGRLVATASYRTDCVDV